MRLDKYLKSTRAIKRRSWAREACEAGVVSINGRLAKPHTDVKEGDRIEVDINGQGKIIQIEVLKIPEKGNIKTEDFKLTKTWLQIYDEIR